MERIADRLREARRNAGFATAEDFAGQVEVAPEIYRGYEDGTRYMSPQLGYRIAQLLGVGWVDLLYGPEYTDDSADFGWQGTSFRRAAPRQAAQIAYADGGGVAVAEAPRRSRALIARRRSDVDELPDLTAPRPAPQAPPPLRGTSPAHESRGSTGDTIAFDELDTQLAAGAGLARASQHPLGGWSVPREVVKTGSRASGPNLKMVAILGDEMEPTFRMNDRVLVDTLDPRPSPSGVFMVWDGMSLVMRRVEIVPGSEPVRLRVSTDNPKYQPAERLLAETLIQGRVIAKWSWV